MKRTAELLIAAGIGTALVLGSTACTDEKPRTTEHSPSPETGDPNHVRAVAMAQRILDLYNKNTNISSREISEKPPHSISVDIDTEGPSKVVLHAQSQTKLANGQPDPDTVVGLNFDVTNNDGSVTSLRLQKESKGHNNWATFWNVEKQERIVQEVNQFEDTVSTNGTSSPSKDQAAANRLEEAIFTQAQHVLDVQANGQLPPLPFPKP